MQTPVVVNISKKNLVNMGYKNLNEWLRSDNHIYIGRNLHKYVHGVPADASKWGNPYTLVKFSRQESLSKFEDYARINLWCSLDELAGKTLGCWCSPLPCHGHVLIKLYKEKFQII